MNENVKREGWLLVIKRSGILVKDNLVMYKLN